MTMVAERPTRRHPVHRGWRPRHEGDFPSLGWVILDWSRAYLPSPADESLPFMFTDEQAQRVVRIYELDPVTGKRLCRRAHEEEAKGWGKSPEAAALAIGEFCAPVLFDGWDADGQPVARPWGARGTPPPWVQIAAVSEAQTENTWHALYRFLTDDHGRAAEGLRIDVGRTLLRRFDQRSAFMERVTASAGSREGQPITHAVLDEPQLWTPSNQGDNLARTILRNLTKTGGWAHFTGNAPVLGRQTVAETFGDTEDGVLHFATRPPEAPREDWPLERKIWAIAHVYRGVPWIDQQRVLADALSPAIPWSEKLRYTFNTRTAAGIEDAWMPADVWDAVAGEVVLQKHIPTHVVVRIAHDHRSAAVAIAQRQGDLVALRVHTFVETEEGEYLSTQLLEDHLRSLRSLYPALVREVYRNRPDGPEHARSKPGPEVMYHGAFFEGSAQRLRASRMVLVDVPSTPSRITPAAETLMRLVTAGQLVQDSDPVLGEHIGNVVAKPADKGWAVAAAAATATPGEFRPILAAHAAMLAVDRAMTAPPSQRNVARRVH